jgi:hypothetical protein
MKALDGNQRTIWGVKIDLTCKFNEAFDANNVDIPFPKQVMHTITE